MAEHIKREDVINALFNGEHNLYSWEEIDEKLSAIPNAEIPEWTSVAERLPDFEGMCLCMRKSYIHENVRHQEIMYFDFDEQCFCSNTNGIFVADGNVTHWMPLPKPPKQ